MCLESAARIPQFCISRSQCCLLALPYQSPPACLLFLSAQLSSLLPRSFPSHSRCTSFSFSVLSPSTFDPRYFPSLLQSLRCVRDILRAPGVGGWGGRKERAIEKMSTRTNVSAGSSFMIYGAGF